MRLHLLSIALAAAFLAGPATAADPPRESGLDIVPTTAFGFVTVRVSDLNTVEALKPVREMIARLEKAEAPIETKFGVAVADIDRVTVFWPALPSDESAAIPVLVVTTRQPFNEAKVLKALKAMPSDAGLRKGFGRRDVYLPVPPRVFAPPAAANPPFGPGGPVPFPPPGIGPGPASGTSGPPRPGPRPPKGEPDLAPGTVPTVPLPGTPPLGPSPKGTGGPGFESRVGDEPKADLPVRPAPAVPEKDAPAPELYFLEGGPFPAVFLLDERNLLFLPSGERDGMGSYYSLIGQLLRRKADGPLAEALADAGKHTLVAAFRVGQLEGLFRHEFPRELVPFRSLLRAQAVVVTADLAANATVTARLTFADAAQARRAEPVLKTLVQLGTETLAELQKNLGKEPDWAPVAGPLLDLAVASLDKAEVKADGSAVTARLEAPIGEAVAKALAAFPDLADAAASRARTMNNLKQIGLAMHNYHDTFGHFPNDIVSAAGKPLLSWRVQILPFIEQDNMYKQLDQTKAWDDPVNARVLEKMPDVFRVFGREPTGKGQTYFQMPSSPQPLNGGMPFKVPGRPLRMMDITDGTSNTLMVVEAAEAVSWAKPDDFTFDPTKPVKLGAPDQKRIFVLFADGSVRMLRRDKVTDDQLRALMTVNGGEVVKVDE